MPTTLLAAAVRHTLSDRGVRTAEISLTLLDDAAITEMNRTHRGRDRPTDVIAFSLGDEEPLGDVYLGYDRAQDQADDYGVSLSEELVRLAVHGTLHVLGLDHPKGPDRSDSPMFREQERIVREVLSDR